MSNRQKNRGGVLEARAKAQELAFAPFSFWAAVVLRDTGLLSIIEEQGKGGASLDLLSEETGISEYGISVLLDFGVDLDLVEENEDHFTLDTVGYLVLNDEMTRVNMDFTRDICYDALPFLEDSVREEKPAGLQTLGAWDTIYEGVEELPEGKRESWYRFEHFYSNRVFDRLMPLIFDEPTGRILDIGGNTGKFAMTCLEHDDDVQVTIMDLPGTIEKARSEVQEAGYEDRVTFMDANLRKERFQIPEDQDVIFMSQFLDCFSENDIVEMLQRIREFMNPDTRLLIVELFPDRQEFDAASFSLNAFSLYFTCVANGDSRMYPYDTFTRLIQEAGLSITREFDLEGAEHTALCCTST